jgi:exodeoxyribonuclease V alpha subunit
MAERFTGTVERVVFYNDTTGFAVLSVKRDGGGGVSVVGLAPPMDEGDDIEVAGHFEVDRRYGAQFKADEIRPVLPSGTDGLLRFFASGRVEGIGPKLAKQLVDKFGDLLPRILEESPEKLSAIRGMGPKRRQQIVQSWREQTSVRDLLIFLGQHGIGTARALRVHRHYGGEAVRIIRQNPYRLAHEVSGIGFLIADSIARSLGIEPHSPFRIRAAIYHLLAQQSAVGHCGVPIGDLLSRSAALLKIDVALIEPVLAEDVAAEALRVAPVGEVPVVFTREMYDTESSIAEILARLVARPAEAVPDLRAVLAATNAPELTDEKHEAIRCAFNSRVAVITGGPGVGKTTVVSAVLAIADALDLTYELAAPTGRAARRMSESSGAAARTIHRLLELNPQQSVFGRDEDNPLDCDLLIIDEVSMVDVPLFEALLRALGRDTRLLLVGDADQLPSVGPGQVLADVIASGVVPVAHLRQIFRQAEGSSIVRGAHKINGGDVPAFDADPSGAFFFFPCADADAARDMILDLVTRRIPRTFGLDPLREVQVLSPMHKTNAGVEELNAALQKVLNPRNDDSAFLERGRATFAPGDKVMQTQNDYEKEVFNGDIGFVRAIDQKEELLRVDFDGRLVDYPFDHVEQLTLAYATTIHKSQGSEFPAVVVPVVLSHRIMLQRNLLYTAVTRARGLVVLVGQKEALRLAVHNATGGRRWTRLRPALVAAATTNSAPG